MFVDRAEAGRQLASRLDHLRGQPLVVVGLPRGGVPVAAEVARALDAPLDVIVVRKLGVPFQPELGMGAIGEDGVRILNEEVVRMAAVSSREVAAVEARERAELERRAGRYRGGQARVTLDGHIVVVVDDGIATGSTARAACQVARAHGAAKVVLAVPVAPRGWEARIGPDADEFVCVATPEPFFAIGQFYADFTQVSDDAVLRCLEQVAEEQRSQRSQRSQPAQPAQPAQPVPTGSAADDPPLRDEEVTVHAGGVPLGGHLTVPEDPSGVVIFAHGSGSSRHSPRNRHVAGVLQDAHIATLLFDLLSMQEELDRTNVFDIELLARRLIDVSRWTRDQPELAGLPVGYFGASTGAGAALWAAAEPGAGIAAVVSRGGRPDLASPHLPAVEAPTLLIVGGKDDVVLDLNRGAAARMRCENEVVVVPGATHLFEEPGTLQIAAETARDWFLAHFAIATQAES